MCQWNAHQQAWWKQATITLSPTDKPWENPLASNFWKSMRTLHCAFHSSVRSHVGDGNSTDFWNDNWYGTPFKYLYPNLYRAALHTKNSVAQNWHTTGWQIQHSNLNLSAQLEKQQLLHSLQSYRLNQAHDTFTWLRPPQQFTVNSAYRFLAYTPSPTSTIKNVWQIRAPLRVLVFAWLLLNNRLTTVDNLVRRGWQLPNMCSMCRSNEESIEHLFQTCPVAKNVRNYVHDTFAHTYSIPTRYKSQRSIEMMMDTAESRAARQWEIVTCFVLWRERCRRIFAGKDLELLMIVREINREWKSWFTNIFQGPT